MKETIVRPRSGEQLPDADGLVREINAIATRLYGAYKPGDTLRCTYANGAEGEADECEVNISPDGVIALARTNKLGCQIGALSPDDPPGRWVLDANGVGIADEATDAQSWMRGELTLFREHMQQPGALTMIPAEG